MIRTLSTCVTSLGDEEVKVSVDVITNNQYSWEELRGQLSRYDCAVISPGPGSSEFKNDFGVCADLLKYGAIPVLGVCLGHQGLAYVYGAKIVRLEVPTHGKIAQVLFDPTSALFCRFSGDSFKAVRYHSLIVHRESLPDCLQEIAWSSDNQVMALAHKTLPLYGVQFHPESICSEMGKQLISNFMQITMDYWKILPTTQQTTKQTSQQTTQQVSQHTTQLTTKPTTKQTTQNYKIEWEKISNLQPFPNTEDVFISLFAQQTIRPQSQPTTQQSTQQTTQHTQPTTQHTTQHTFWLDSAGKEPSMNRFSYMGKSSEDSPFSVIRYYAATKEVHVTNCKGPNDDAENTVQVLDKNQSFFDYLGSIMGIEENQNELVLPFMFHGGFVGYFGYEMKLECMPLNFDERTYQSPTPDAVLFFVDRLIVFDHFQKDIYVVTTIPTHLQTEEVKNWRQQIQIFLKNSQNYTSSAQIYMSKSIEMISKPCNFPDFSLERPYEQYISDIQYCLEEIKAGDSYELCLTNKILTKNYKHKNPIFLYLLLRQRNGAPFSAFLDCGDFQICSCSPEKFVSVDEAKIVTTKPIKGTLPRGKTDEEDKELYKKLATDQKSFSENLMIVDLMRNDLGKVCKIGSVRVPKLMAVESYATVHQLVSTVVGQLDNNTSALECLRHIFPPGSMTGAPKLRSVQILESVEHSGRGVYSGTLGFLGLNGTCDLSVVIRTIVLHEKGLNIGCGGAIVVESDPVAEFEEILLKASALVNSIILSHSLLHNKPIPTKLDIQGVPQHLYPPTMLTTNTSNNYNTYNIINDTKLTQTTAQQQQITTIPPPLTTDFSLLETMLYTRGEIFLIRKHTTRLQKTASFFRYPFTSIENVEKNIYESVQNYVKIDLRDSNAKREIDAKTTYDVNREGGVKTEEEQNKTAKIRVLLHKNGKLDVEYSLLPPMAQKIYKISLAKHPINSNDEFILHKTTNRQIYQNHTQNKPQNVDDVLLYNERGEVTETTICNIAFLIDNKWVTPKLECGLLAGTMRAELLQNGSSFLDYGIVESIITLEYVKTEKPRIIVFNSVRKILQAELVM